MYRQSTTIRHFTIINMKVQESVSESTSKDDLTLSNSTFLDVLSDLTEVLPLGTVLERLLSL